VQDLRDGGLHPGALAGGEDDDGGRADGHAGSSWTSVAGPPTTLPAGSQGRRTA
jgi:hypothetical protein